ncbi:PD40 domain-containing protein [candidate division KSB1 bacterium]|nr:PD40 domain-containing protein [candidate division KSB1 bacterium]
MRLKPYAGFLFLLFCISCSVHKPVREHNAPINRLPTIEPDYTDIVLPPNSAPMNFIVQEAATAYYVEFSAKTGKSLVVSSSSPSIRIPFRPWKELLNKNRGHTLQITVYIRDQHKAWHSFQPILNEIAADDIQPYLAYRLIKPLYVYWDQMGLYQRDLTSFRERPIILNRTTGGNCVNCHSFHNYNPDRFLFHMRAGEVGTAMMLAYDGNIYKIDTSTSFNRATAYRAWHPNGQIVAFSANTVNQFFHTVGENRDVYDKASDLVLYNVANNMITSCPDIATSERMETYPEWSPDGKYLYFCATDGLQVYDPEGEHPYRQIKYDLMRIPFDAATNFWGSVEPVLLASEFGQSVTHPKVSPDGQYVLFCMSSYGNFSIYKQDADLYLLDTQTKEYDRLYLLNSDKTESYHSWSRDGRWIVFSSKREDGVCARPYFSHVDASGHFSKPYVLPQKNPAFYRTFFKTYNIPEFISGPVRVRPQKLARSAWDNNNVIKANLDPKLGERVEESEDPMWKPVQKGRKKI